MLQGILDVVYPPKCALCGVFHRDPICPACLSEFVPNEALLTTDQGPLAYRVHLYSYESRPAQAVRRLKYDRVTSLIPPLAAMVREAYDTLRLDPDFIVPIPIHWSRRTMRGFNQAEELCDALPREKLAPHLLRRTRRTRPQVGLDRDQRRRNLVDAFAARSVEGKSVLLVDDVSTSGHTAEECALALLRAGAVEVGLLTLTGE